MQVKNMKTYKKSKTLESFISKLIKTQTSRKHFIMIFVCLLFFSLSVSTFGQNGQKYIHVNKVTETINITPGQTKEIKKVGRKNVVRMYRVRVSVQTEVSVTITNIKGKSNYTLGVGNPYSGDIEPLGYDNDSDSLIYSATPLTRKNESGWLEFYIGVKPQTVSATYKLTVAAKPIVYKPYNLQTCLGNLPIKIGTFTDSPKLFVDNASLENYNNLKNYTSVSSSEYSNGGDLTGDNQNEIAIVTDCAHGSDDLLNYSQLHILGIGNNTKPELATLKLPKIEIPKPKTVNLEEDAELYWIIDKIEIKNRRVEINYVLVIYPGGDYTTPTDIKKRFIYKLENNQLVELKPESGKGPLNKFIREDIINNTALKTDSKVPQEDKVASVIKTTGKQTLRKDRFTIDINTDWEILEEPHNGFIVAAPGKYVMKNNRPEISVGFFCGVTDAIVSGWKGMLNTATEVEIQANLKDATKTYLKALTRSNKMKKTGDSEDTFLSGQSALLTKYEGVSAQTGKSESVYVYTTLLSNQKMFFIVIIAPVDGHSEYLQESEQIRNSLKFN